MWKRRKTEISVGERREKPSYPALPHPTVCTKPRCQTAPKRGQKATGHSRQWSILSSHHLTQEAACRKLLLLTNLATRKRRRKETKQFLSCLKKWGETPKIYKSERQ